MNEKQLATQLARHSVPFAFYGEWNPLHAGFALAMNRFVSANDTGCGDGKFPTRPDGATNQYALMQWRRRNPTQA